MRSVLAAAYAAWVVTLSMPVAAQTVLQPRIEFTLYDTQTELRSLSGDPLPLAPALGWQRHGLNARTYSEQTMAIDDLQDAPLASATQVEVVDGPGYSQLTVEWIMGDMHAVAGFTGPTPDWATSDFLYGSNVVLTLPARSVLTMSGKIDVKGDAAHEQNYTWFERGLISVEDGTTGGFFALDTWAPQEGFSISAVNPLDVEATFYYYSSLGGVAFSVIAVPEPSAAAMATAGVLLMGALLRRQRRGRADMLSRTSRSPACVFRRTL